MDSKLSLLHTSGPPCEQEPAEFISEAVTAQLCASTASGMWRKDEQWPGSARWGEKLLMESLWEGPSCSAR